jgi:hypothetical protein
MSFLETALFEDSCRGLKSKKGFKCCYVRLLVFYVRLLVFYVLLLVFYVRLLVFYVLLLDYRSRP